MASAALAASDTAIMSNEPIVSQMEDLTSSRAFRVAGPAQITDARISVCHGVGGMFAASGTIIMSSEPP
jgi:hypothetical protein